MKSKFSIPIEYEHDVHLSDNSDFERVVLLLHGFQLDGRFMYKRYAPLLDERFKVVAPNAPFPVPLKKSEEWLLRYSWYFFDPIKKNYYLNYEPAARWLAALLKEVNPQNKPVAIIGYSQGTYIAPKAAELIPATDKVVGINGIFRPSRFRARQDVVYHQINGSMDEIVDPVEARKEFESMKAEGKFIELEAAHPLNREMISKSLELLSN